MLIIDFLFFAFAILLLFFGFDLIKLILKRWLPSGKSFNSGIKNFASAADDDRITPEMVGLTVIVNNKGGSGSI